MTDFDVIIVGGGIAGASLAAAVAGRARVAVIESEDQCGYHSTGRSAAFWLASYGGPGVMPLTTASHAFLQAGWPSYEHSWLRLRGAYHLVGALGDWREEAAVVRAADPAAEWLQRGRLEQLLPGLRPGWSSALSEPSCADIDVAGLHQACLAAARRAGAVVLTGSGLERAERIGSRWTVDTSSQQLSAPLLVNAAGAWADDVANRCGVRPIDIEPRRRTMVQLRVDRGGLANLPLIIDSGGGFYFKGEGDRQLWLSPHDETAVPPCDVAAEEMDVATAIDRFEQVVNWSVEAVERTWAGLRSFAPDRLPVIGFDREAEGFFWCAGQGGFGIQTAPAAAALAASLLLKDDPPRFVADLDVESYAPSRFR